MNIADTCAPKSDQLNADDLIGGPRTIKVTKVSRGSGDDQPISIHFEGDNSKPYRPCKSMRRVLLKVWGQDGSAYAGRRMTLYRDDAVQFGGVAVGGIRISHMSGITSAVTMALTEKRASRKPFTVKPLAEERAAPQQSADQPRQQTGRERLMTAARERAAEGSEALRAFRASLTEQQDRALEPILAELDRTASYADAADDGPQLEDDGFPGFAPTEEEVA